MWHALLVLDWVARCGEDDIEFLEGAAAGLDEEEVDDGNEDCVEDCVDDVGVVSDICEGGGYCHDHQEAESPVGDGAQCGTLSMSAKGSDFSGVEEWTTDPGETEEGVEEEEQAGAGELVGARGSGEEDGDCDEASCHS